MTDRATLQTLIDDAIIAVLVDGVGRTREMRLHLPVPSLYFAKPTVLSVTHDPTPVFATVDRYEFRRIAELSDGRHVYGFRFAVGKQYQLWSISASWAIGIDPRALDEISLQMGSELEALDPYPPVVRLFDRTVEEPNTRLFTRHVAGLARR